MDCWTCKTPLLWGGDHDLEEDECEEFCMVSNFCCPNCEAHVEFYVPRDGHTDFDSCIDPHPLNLG